MATVNRQFLPRHWILLRCRCCLNCAVVSPTKSQLTFSVANIRHSCSNQPITWLHNCVTIFAIIAVTSKLRAAISRVNDALPLRFYFSSERGESLGTRLSLCGVAIQCMCHCNDNKLSCASDMNIVSTHLKCYIALRLFPALHHSYCCLQYVQVAWRRPGKNHHMMSADCGVI